MPVSLLIGMQWGLLGACLAWVIIYPCYFLIVLKRSLPILGLKISDYLTAMRPAALIAIIMYLAVIGLRQVVTENLFIAPIDLVILVMTGALVYGLLIFFTQRETCIEIIAQIKR